MKCVSCHSTAETGDRASFPEAAKCQVCHAQMDLPKTVKPETPIYVLPDFVFFSHAKHVAGCETCHGDNPDKPFLLMKMKACVDCHKTNKAAVMCNTCHDLSP